VKDLLVYRSMTRSSKQQKALATGSTVYLRPPTAEDSDELIHLHQASLRFYRGLASPISTPQQFANYLSRCQRDDFEGLLVCQKNRDAIVGSINLSQIFRGGFQSAYLGYQVGAPFAGQGYMTEALQLVLRYVFDKMKLHRLEANIQPKNAASITLVTRAGFTKEGYSRRYLKICGRWRDHERWAILTEDWRRRKRRRRGAV
jgi:[ribosomal protein S5]-alanine N-acetyltransferase